MLKVVCFLLVLLVSSDARAQYEDYNGEAAFSVLSDRLDRLEINSYKLKSTVEEKIAIFTAQINDIGDEFNEMSERMNAIFNEFTEYNNEHMKADGGVMEYISSMVQKEISDEKVVLREFVDRYERELENLGRYVSDNIAFNNDTEDKEELYNTIPASDSSTNTCKMCMLVATTTEKKSRRLEQKLADLSKQTLERVHEYEALQSDVGDTMEKVLEIETDGDYQTENLRNLTYDVDTLRTMVDSLGEKHERTVGFTARLTKSRTYYPGNTLLAFDEVKYNHGKGYNPQTGIFTAPTSGTYLLSFNVQSTSMFDAHVCLIVDGTLRLTAVAGKGHRVTGGNTGIVYMEEGEEAWVRTTTLKPRFGIWPHRTTFSGVLLD